jgi:hypothetical protein
VICPEYEALAEDDDPQPGPDPRWVELTPEEYAEMEEE